MLRKIGERENVENEKILLNVEETATYLNLGKTKTRQLMKENEKILLLKSVIATTLIKYYWISG